MRYAAFLRAVNVAGNQLSMSSLKVMLTGLHLDDPQTLLQSGNIVFGSEKLPADLESMLENETEKRLKVKTEYFVRDAKELQRLINKNPFPKEAREDPGRLVVMFLKSPPAAKNVAVLQSKITGPEVVKALGAHLYITYPAGQGRSKLTNTVIQAALGTHGTARNWNTLVKTVAALRSAAGAL